MSQFLLPDDELDLDRALAPHLSVRAEPPRAGTWTFYDTFDGRLHAAGLALRHSDGRLRLLDRASGAERASAPQDTAPERLFAADLPPALRGPLAATLEVRALMPVARVNARSRRLAVVNDDEKIVVRLEAVVADGLGARVLASSLRGYDKDLERVERVLADELHLPVTEAALADEAIAATGASPAGTSSKLDVPLAADQPAGEAAEAILARLHEVATANLPGTLADVDTEFLHDLRVAVRRARSLLRQLKSVFPPEPLGHLRTELRRIQRVTGELRDLDVQLLDFEHYEDRDALEPLHEVLVAHRARAYDETRRELRSKRTRDAFKAWAALRAGDTTPPLRDVAGARIRKVYRRMVKMGSAIGDDSPHEALHELRKTGKELRYLLEFFGGVFGEDQAKPMIKALKALQDVLGRFQDFEVQGDTLRGLTAEVGAHPDGAAALLAMGAHIDHLAREQARARAEFSAQFADFAAKPRRTAVKRSFR